jgi:hypothetical protein
MKLFIVLALFFCQSLYGQKGQKTHRDSLPAEHFISFKIVKLHTQLYEAKDFDFTIEIKNISKQKLNFYRNEFLNFEFEIHKCLTPDSSCNSDTCITFRDPILLADDLKIYKYSPNESLAFSSDFLNPCTGRKGLYKIRFFVNLGANNPLIKDYYSKWYYVTVVTSTSIH